MLDAGVTQEEARWLNQESARHHNQPDTPRDQALAYCRALVGRYGGADALATLPVEDGGPCMDGTDPHNRHDTNVRYRIGHYSVCRDHAILRLRAAAHAEQPVTSRLAPRPGMPADLHTWTLANAHLDTNAMRGLFAEWRIDTDLALELLDLAADTARQESEVAA